MTVSTHQVRADFDRIALLTEQTGGERDLYHSYLLRHLPKQCESALEIGCGAGAFTRHLAARARRVTGIDLSPQMLRLAQQQQQSASLTNVAYILGDIMRLSLPPESYDCIVSIATLHHLSPDQALPKIKSLLKPGGVLVINDLVSDAGLFEKCLSVLALPVSVGRRFCKTGRLLPPKALREAWAEHGKQETYLTLDEVREMCKRYLPQARVRRHLLWRYTVVWHKRVAV
jgi:ubiquinone/menaquinone biosynthesis C-methylase UbiE